MKKIISTTFLFGILLSGGMLSAQKMTQEKMKAIYSDDVATFKKQFAPGDYNKCFLVGNIAYSPLGFSVMSDRKNIINFLLDNKANVNKKCQNKTPLEVADDTKGTEEIKKILTEKGGNRN